VIITNKISYEHRYIFKFGCRCTLCAWTLNFVYTQHQPLLVQVSAGVSHPPQSAQGCVIGHYLTRLPLAI